jgi:hypothetical protein
MKGKELMVRERGQMGPVARPIKITKDSPGGLPGCPPRQGHTLMGLTFMALSSRIGSAFVLKLKNQVPSSSFGQTKVGCRLIAGPISKSKRVAHHFEIQTKVRSRLCL